MLAYVSYFLESGLAIRFTRGKGEGMTGGGRLELQQQSTPNVAARMTTETNRDMDMPVASRYRHRQSGGMFQL
jgi:hypothetical protein